MALVISGPNAGGKTIVLKTCGLMALMVRYAVPIPAKSGARVDLFEEIMADIGDMQSVTSDLSTFSGHLVICREILETAGRVGSRTGNNYCLALLDEVGTGTDPAQGTALAQAILETLVGYGTRVMTTTHYSRIKDLAVYDKRFRIAAMEFIDNKPTYRLREGSVGESYALELAQRMDLPSKLLDRAHILLDDETRRLIALQQRLEEETSKARKLQEDLKNEILEADDRNQLLEKRKQELEAEIQRVRDGQIQSYLADLKEKEKHLEMMVIKVEEALKQKQKSKEAEDVKEVLGEVQSVESLMEDTKTFLKNERIETEKQIVAKTVDDLGVEPLGGVEIIEAGTTLVVLEPGALFGSRGVVVNKGRGKGRIQLNVAGIEIKLERHLLGRPKLMALSKNPIPELIDTLSTKDKKLLQMIQEEMVPAGPTYGKTKNTKQIEKVQRTAANTLDIKTMTNLSEAQMKTMQYLEVVVNKAYDQMEETEDGGIRMKATSVIYVVHGAQAPWKTKFRAWLRQIPVVKKWYVADLSDGGEAATVVELNFEM